MVHVLEEIEAYAKKENIPIMQKEGIDFLTNYIKENKVESILEIGSAIGYSAIKMALVDKKIHIVTIERDEERYKKAIKNIKKLNLEKQIEVHNCDAFTFETEEKFDLLFIDAAKAQYIPFFEKFKKNVKETGTIISDNLAFHGLVGTDTKNYSKGLRGIVRKLEKYITFLKENEDYETSFLEIGDGIGITKKIEKEKRKSDPYEK